MPVENQVTRYYPINNYNIQCAPLNAHTVINLVTLFSIRYIYYRYM
jgi:hypothetical protein